MLALHVARLPSGEGQEQIPHCVSEFNFEFVSSGAKAQLLLGVGGTTEVVPFPLRIVAG